MLLRKLVGIRKEETSSMEQYFTEVKDTMDQLEGIGVNIPEDLCILLLLNSLPREYQLFSRTQTGRDELPSFLELEARLLDEEMQLKLDQRSTETPKRCTCARASPRLSRNHQHRGPHSKTGGTPRMKVRGDTTTADVNSDPRTNIQGSVKIKTKIPATIVGSQGTLNASAILRKQSNV
jgi:hypothetical protein